MPEKTVFTSRLMLFAGLMLLALVIGATAGAAGSDTFVYLPAVFSPLLPPSWEEVGVGSATGGGISNTPLESYQPSTAFSPDNLLYVGWHDSYGGGNVIYLRRWNGTNWEELGGSATEGGISGAGLISQAASVAVAPNGIPYVAWSSFGFDHYDIYVRRWNGSSWEEVGANSASNGGISNSPSYSDGPSIAIAPNGTPYVAWQDSSDGDAEIYVRRFNGSTWEEVGAGSATGGGVSNDALGSVSPAIAISMDGTPYLTWQQYVDNHAEIYVRRFNGSAWEAAGAGSATGGGISNTYESSELPSIAVAPNGVPYVAWTEDATQDGEIYVRRFNGTTWEEIGPGSASVAGISNSPTMYSTSSSVAIAPDNTPYIAWGEATAEGDGEIYVRFWNGSSWAEAGSGAATEGGVSDNSTPSGSPYLAVSPAGVPYVAWMERTPDIGEIYVRRRLQ